MRDVDDLAVGVALRSLRERRSWRQRDLAERAGVSQSLISFAERGMFGQMSFGSIRRIFEALEARLELRVVWRAGELDRLVDQRHAAIVESVIRVLRDAGWEVRAEVPFSHFGDRGSVDVFAWHAASGAILLIEVKSQVYSVEETLRRFQTKIRLAAVIAKDHVGWTPRIVGSALVLPESAGTRRRIDAHPATFSASFPDRGRELRAWLRRPDRRLAAIWFLSANDLVRAIPRTVRRVRVGKAGVSSGMSASHQGQAVPPIRPTPAIPDRTPELARAGFIADRMDLGAERDPRGSSRD
jgi:transcriptional regulator with XRE-family HTH domain